jgi:hypothetical protein
VGEGVRPDGNNPARISSLPIGATDVPRPGGPATMSFAGASPEPRCAAGARFAFELPEAGQRVARDPRPRRPSRPRSRPRLVSPPATNNVPWDGLASGRHPTRPRRLHRPPPHHARHARAGEVRGRACSPLAAVSTPAPLLTRVGGSRARERGSLAARSTTPDPRAPSSPSSPVRMRPAHRPRVFDPVISSLLRSLHPFASTSSGGRPCVTSYASRHWYWRAPWRGGENAFGR